MRISLSNMPNQHATKMVDFPRLDGGLNLWEMDYRINYNQGMGAFNAARMKGIPAELLIYPDENHWVLKPQNGILWQRTFFNWLDRWLKK